MADRGHGNIHSLVVGGTGILRPAVETLEGRGWQVTVLARGVTDEPPHRFAAAVDAADAPALGVALDDAISARGPFGLALVYAPFAPASSMAAIAERISSHLIYVLTTEWEAPGADRAERDAWAPHGAGGLTQRVTLGWTQGSEGPRWHTPEEVSQAALDAIERSTREITLGTLRPWSDRPST
jgi:hypothetical protein